MSKPQPLSYRELIAPKRRYGPKVLTPEDIPIHPHVYNNPFSYTPEFTREVLGRIRESMIEDDRTIREVLGIETGFEIQNDCLIARSVEREYTRPDGTKRKTTTPEHRLDYSFVHFSPNPGKLETGVSIGSANIDIVPHLACHIRLEVSLTEAHPMSPERLEEYAYASDLNLRVPQIHAWYRHNLDDASATALHFFRNFAILFNNLGLEVV